MQLTIECRNIRQDVGARDALKAGGGRTTVPCLLISEGEQVQWLYESSDIVRFLRAWSASVLSG